MHMLRMSLAVVLACAACARDAAPPQPPSNKLAPEERSRSAADPLAFLPADADIIVGVDARALRASALWAEYQPQLTRAIGPRLADVQRTCGFDPIQAIDSVALAVYSKETSSSVMVVRGLDRDRMIACVEARMVPDATVTRDRGMATITMKGGADGVAAFADPATLVIVERPNQARPDGLRAVLQSGAPLRSSPAFLAMFDGLERGAALWIVINGRSGVFGSMPVHPLAVYGTVRATAGVSARAHLRMATADEATQLTSLIQGQAQQVAQVFDRLDAAAEGSVVTLTVEMSLDKLRSLIAMFLPLAGGAGTSP